MKRRPRKHARKLGIRKLARVTSLKLGCGAEADRKVHRYLTQVLAGQFS